MVQLKGVNSLSDSLVHGCQ